MFAQYVAINLIGIAIVTGLAHTMKSQKHIFVVKNAKKNIIKSTL